ncbi:MAG: hypothetical protein VYD87_10705 [Pseudomonadota bacterium]|nr:hypothetical protein [Pseudomonadota bacterium]
METAQETGDPGDQPELKADDAAYDNVADRGQEAPAPEEDAAAGLRSADHWMNALDTRPTDFLRLRFAMEAAQRPAGRGGDGMAEDAE